MPCWSTPHIASRKSDTTRIAVSRAEAGPGSPSRRTSASRIASSSAVRSWLTLKLARSKDGSPIPAYSQSTIRMRDPSSMKLALSRSLWHGRSSIGSARQASSMRRPTAAASSYSAGMGTPRADGQRAIRLDDAQRDEQAGDRRTAVDPPQRVGDPRQHLGLADLVVLDRRALDEAGDEVALGPDERDDLRPDADPGRGDRRGVLDLAADPEQVRVVAGQADDVALRPAADA